MRHLLTTREVAARLKLHPATVSQHAKYGRIPGATDISRTPPGTKTRHRAVWRYDADVLEAWITSRTSGDTWRKPERERGRS